METYKQKIIFLLEEVHTEKEMRFIYMLIESILRNLEKKHRQLFENSSE